MIDQEKANELFVRYRQTGDTAIRNQLVENYIYIAQILAKKFVGRGVEYEDLYQIASEALISGVEKFNPELGNKFTTYITPYVTGMIKNYFRDFSRSIRIPRRVYALNMHVRQAINEYYRNNGVKPTIKQLSELLKVSEEEIIEALESKAPVSLDTTVQSEDGEAPLSAVIADKTDSFEQFIDNDSLRNEIAKLPEIEQQVVNLRFMQGKSQSETGAILGVSQMFVSRAERKITEKLRDALL